MMCGHAKELIAASWTRELTDADEVKLRQHVSGCSECSVEMTQLTRMWDRLADLPVPEPSSALDVRWQSTLESLTSVRRQTSWRFSLDALWPRRPVWQATIAAGCLAIGFMLPHPAGDRAEVAKLRDEVALSLMQQQSATERLRGVDYSARMPGMEPAVVSALIQAVNHDPSVNVRLAAVDALTKVSADARVRQSMTQSLSEQESPMVQAALIDYAIDARDAQAVGPLRRLRDRPDLNPAIRQRADVAMQQLDTRR